MIELKTKTKKWGNSTGIILPKKFGIKPDQEVNVHIEPAQQFTKVKEIFGILKLKRSVKSLMKEIDGELNF